MKQTLRNARTRAGIVRDLFAYLWKAKVWWLMPLVVALLLFALLALLASSSAVAPFIYTLF
ncbi:hypothetical protein GX586_04415 [bacterium]|nr:hypothetical protein [bacterium]